MSRKRAIDALSAIPISPKITKQRNPKTQLINSSEHCDLEETGKNVPKHSLTSSGTKLPIDFYEVDSVSLAQSLIGKILCRKLSENGIVLKGRIVETEAYPGMSHSLMVIYSNSFFSKVVRIRVVPHIKVDVRRQWKTYTNHRAQHGST